MTCCPNPSKKFFPGFSSGFGKEIRKGEEEYIEEKKEGEEEEEEEEEVEEEEEETSLLSLVCFWAVGSSGSCPDSSRITSAVLVLGSIGFWSA